MTFTLPWTSMGFLNAVGATCVLCTIPIFDPSARLLVCSRGFSTYFYVVAMEFFQPVRGTCDILMRLSHAAPTA